MSTFVIGDVHGSIRTLKSLLEKIGFKESKDRLWMVGDLVNRGSGSLATLRWVREKSDTLGKRFVNVLGNHDLHLLALDCGVQTASNPDLVQVLEAPDRRELIHWLRSRPFAHREKVEGRDTLLVHAGLWPHWTAKRAIAESGRLSTELARPDRGDLLLMGPKALGKAPGGLRKMGDSLYAFTSLRTLHGDRKKSPCRFKGTLAEVPAGCVPWFSAKDRKWRGTRVVFGHWAALGLHQTNEVVGLDSGCAWGGRLTALRLDDNRIFQIPRDGRDESRHP